MRSNYKKLGAFIRPVNVRNTDLKVEKLLGVSIQKVLMPSIANTVGTNMNTYRIIEKNQFAYGPVTSRNGDKISIALYADHEKAIISQAYTVFEVKDENRLDPEYLMMWFRRPEFDRYARYHSHGSARETFDWEDLCDVELPVPSIEKQREMVAEYNTVVNRIRLNEQLNQKLEETAQTIYRRWFVEFEFPISKEQAAGMGQLELEGKPYKSSGGKMVWNEELGKEVPEEWRVSKLESYLDCNVSNYSTDYDFDELLYLDTSNITNNKFDEIKLLKVGSDTIPSRAKRLVTHNDILYSTVRPNLKHFGLIKYPPENMVVSTGFAVLNNKANIYCSEILYQILIEEEVINTLQSKAEMSVSTYPSIKPEDLLEIVVALPKEDAECLHIIKSHLSATYELIYYDNLEIDKLNQMKAIMLSKMTKVEPEKQLVE
ncbi:restriction endonuclease subunit S [Cyclobacterium salsum]|uniref:restriction endonuclease subunit S n=1 Tax=Cyclobacterium salsum TaxID=2666329 RepID=UPI0013920B9F|nr:restriction endonuclease subunit S [Cyclobacterium salsum]